MRKSTARSAPQHETIDTSPAGTSGSARLRTPFGSILSNMPLSAMMPRVRSLSGFLRLWSISFMAVQGLLEWRLAEPPERRNERFLRALAARDIGIDQPLDGVGHVLRVEAGPEDLADR